MLIYSDVRYLASEINMLIFKAKDDSGYFYVHRMLYDQAVILDDLYGDNPEKLCEEIAGPGDMRNDVREFLDTIPKPINILGCFLLLVESEIEDPVDRIGAIHVMSGPMSMREMIKIPREARTQFSFSLSISEEYKLAWDRFFSTAIPYSDDFYRTPGLAPMNGTATVTQAVADEEVEEEKSFEDQLIEALMDVPDDIFDLDDEDEENEDVPEEAENPVEEPAPVEEAPPEPVIKTGLDFVREMGK